VQSTGEVKQVTKTMDEPLFMTPMWETFLELTAGETWKFTPRERACLQSWRESVQNYDWFLEALDDGCEVD